MAKELSIDEHNEEVFKKIADLKAKIDDLNLTFRSESEKKQATLQECNAMFNKRGKQ